jgi:hypothetical protein
MPEPQTDPPSDASATAHRPARALAAWMSTDELRRLKRGDYDAAGHGRAREALRRRPAELDQSGLIEGWPTELDDYAAALRASEGATPMFARDWELAVITDLRRIVAAQPTVFFDPVQGYDPPPSGDLAALARVTLPLSPPAAQIPASFDEDRQAWNISSLSPNLRITGNFGGEIRPNVLGFGFLVQVLTSFVSVAEFRGRYILRDGYHRAYRLLSAGVFTVPAFVRRFGDDESLFRAGMLAESIYCGERPPTLHDYHDDSVAEDVDFADTDTTILVQATPPGLAFGRLA